MAVVWDVVWRGLKAVCQNHWLGKSEFSVILDSILQNVLNLHCLFVVAYLQSSWAKFHEYLFIGIWVVACGQADMVKLIVIFFQLLVVTA
jgi:hypothetical protein